MKPSFRNLIKSTLPALIVVPAMLQHAQAQGNNITPDAAGNVVVAGTFDETNGSNWSILATGGTTPPFSVTIDKGALLTGNGPFANGVTVFTSNYTITNSGSLNVGAYGILSNVGGTIVNNQAGGLIQGGYDGINFDSRSIGSISSVISGISGSNGTVNNDGIIIGNNNGIYAGTGLVVDNSITGEITGSNGNGIYSYDDLALTNLGSITGGSSSSSSNQFPNEKLTLRYGGGSGVFANNNAVIANSGSITGSNGITTRDNLKLTNSGLVSGTGSQGITVSAPYYLGNGDGISTGNLAEILNHSTGAITGTYNGIRAGSDLKLTNAGGITGGSIVAPDSIPTALDVQPPESQYIGSGVVAGAQAEIDNSGSILGFVHGIDITESEFEEQYFALSRAVNVAAEIIAPTTSNITSSHSIVGLSGNGIDGSQQIEFVTNTGTISGQTAAIDLRGGDDTLNLNYGSNVTGDVIGGEGTDQLNFGSGSESFNEIKNIVHGNVYGFESTTKTGTGFAFIGGPGESFNVFTDQIAISGGGLIINGNLASLSEGKTQVTLSNGSTLDGTGTWNADLLVSSGGLSAGGTNSQLEIGDDTVVAFSSSLNSASKAATSSAMDSVGTLTLNGNVSFSNPTAASDSYIRVDIIPQTAIINGVNSDLIVQNGAGNTFDLAGANLRLAPTDINQTLTDGTYTIIDSDTPLLGTKQLGTLGIQFNDNAPDTGKFIANQGGPNNLNTVVARYFTTTHVTDPAAVAPDQVVPLAAPTTSVKNGSNLEITIAHDFGALPGLSRNQAALASAINGFVGSGNPLIQDFIAALDYSDLATVQNTLATLDPGNAMGLASAVVNSNYRLHRLAQEHLAAIRGTSQTNTSTGATSTDAKGVITAGATTTSYGKRGNAWGSVSYDGQDYEAGGGADFDGDAGAFTAGIDWLVAPQLVVGIMLDGSKGNYDGSSSNSSDIDSFRGAVYGTWGSGAGFYSDALIGFGTHDLTSKLGAAGVLGTSVSNDTDANSFQAMWTAGYTMVHENVKHGPFAGLEYQNVDIDGYNQSGPLPISANGFDIDSLRALIGYRATAAFGQFRPYASVAYAHEFEDGTVTQSASFAGAAFNVEGAAQSSAFLITIGTGYSLTESLSLDLGYRGELATDDGITSNGGSFGVNYSF